MKTLLRPRFGHLFAAAALLTVCLPQKSAQAYQGYYLTTPVVGNGTVVTTVVKEPTGRLPGYVRGTVISITATPAKGWVFVGWSGDATGKDATTQVTMDADKTVTATFVPGNPALQIGGEGKEDAVFKTGKTSCEIRGICHNVDVVYWRFLGESKYHAVDASGEAWKAVVRPVSKGNNYLRVYGLNTASGKKTPVHNGLVIGQ
jgi:uncharacterized repeat protein (TIGR02543 family)